MQWEYHVEKFRILSGTFWGDAVSTNGVEEKLTQLGIAGWELVSVVPQTRNCDTHFLIAVFKRYSPDKNGDL